MVDDVRYEVRTAGNTRRLYTNGAFHSQYNPGYVFSGAVWDLLTLPVLYPTSPINKVLVLGVGGGTVIHNIMKLIGPTEVTGIEIDPVHITIATDHFDLNYPGLTLVNDDAMAWLRKSRAKFDLIIDDVFQHSDADPERPFPANSAWFSLLTRHLMNGGSIVQNHIDRGHARKAKMNDRRFHRLAFETAGYENTILAYLGKTDNRRTLIRHGETRLAALPYNDRRRLRAGYVRI